MDSKITTVPASVAPPAEQIQPTRNVTSAAAAGAAAGATAGRMMAESAVNAGLKGIWGTIGNITAVTFVMVLTYFMYRDMASAQKDERAIFRDTMREQRESDARLREAQNAELRSFSTEFRAGMTEFRAMVRELRVFPPPVVGGREPAPSPKKMDEE